MKSLRRWFVAVFVVGTVLITAAQQLDKVGPWWLELSRYLPFYAFAPVAAIALWFSLRLGRWWIGAVLLSCAVFGTINMGLVWNTAIADPGGTRIRLMTYNIKALRASEREGGFDSLALEVARHKPDILVMQDADGLLIEFGDTKVSTRPVFGLESVYAVDQYVIASRFKLRECRSAGASRDKDELHYLTCVADVGGRDVNVVTTHFESPRSGLNAARRQGLRGIDEWRENFMLRLAQSIRLAGELGAVKRPLIVAGDLNAPESSAVIRKLLDIGLRDAFSIAGRGYGYTHGHSIRYSIATFLRIDHILVSPEIAVIDCFVGSPVPSDHRPVIADLRLRP